MTSRSASLPPARVEPAGARWFAEEVRPHEPALRAWLQSRFPDLSEVDDVVQESYLSMLRARRNGSIGSANNYLFAVARNAALAVFRKRKLDLRVSNLFNEDMLLYYTTAQRPPGGDITNPSRVATPSQFSFIVPRNYTLTPSVCKVRGEDPTACSPLVKKRDGVRCEYIPCFYKQGYPEPEKSSQI